MAERPDLNEFLAALDGFLEQKSNVSSQDPSFLRFLEIFCRSVGSTEGHLLKFKEEEGLQSIVSFGLPKDFESELNEALQVAGRELTPLDAAFRDQQVVAVVEAKRGSGVPVWFLEILARHGFKSLIAVPLVGQSRPVGILCAYYRDVCLFDKGTVDRLMTVGRMVGAATENSMVAGRMESMGANDKTTDEYLQLLTAQPAGKVNVFQALLKMIARTLVPSGLVCGPLRVVGHDFVLTVVEGTGVPTSAVSQRFAMPPHLAQQLLVGKSVTVDAMSADEWGPLRALVPSKSVTALCQPISWEKQPHAAVLAWRTDKRPYTPEEVLLVSRLAGMSALALRSS